MCSLINAVPTQVENITVNLIEKTITWEAPAPYYLYTVSIELLVDITFSIEVPSQVEDITVNPDEKTITWAAPAEPNGIIVGYRVQYWELGRRDTTEEVNITAEELVFLYSKFSKCSTAYTTHSLYITIQT